MDCSLPGSSLHWISSQEYWSGLSFLSRGDLPDPGIRPRSPALQAGSSLSEPPGKPTEIAQMMTVRPSPVQAGEASVSGSWAALLLDGN